MSEQVQAVTMTRQKKWIAGLSIALTLTIGILIGTVISGKTSAMKNFTFAGKGAATLPVPDAIPSSNSFAGIVNRVEPAVVNISTTQVMEKKPSAKRRRTPPQDEQQDDPMQDFFDRFFDGKGGEAPPTAERSLGSGVIVDKRGFILTKITSWIRRQRFKFN